MPSAANVKIDKQINSDSALADPSQNLNLSPLRQAITAIEHKIRNLEKRKSKLESYKELQNAGKELNADQKTAVAKYAEVISTLDFSRDLCKQFLVIAVSSEKEAKKLAKKEAAAKYQAELAGLREILLVQDALHQMGGENVRDDFLNGRNGAAQLSETDLKLLDDLYPAVTPKHEAGNPTAFTNEVQAAAEHLLAVVDGKQKEVFSGNYSQIKEILGKIHESGYFDQAQGFDEEPAAEPEETPAEQHRVEVQESMPPQQVVVEEPRPQQVQPIVIESVAMENRSVHVEQQPPVAVEPPMPPVETVMPLEPIYYQQMMPPQPRPIAEMLGQGTFFFLQESEIDPPEQIPTQTYTNQTYGEHLPQPHPQAVPMPAHFVPNPAPSHQVPPNNGSPPAMMNYQAAQPAKNGVEKPPHKGARNPNGNPYYQNNGYGGGNRQQRSQNGSRGGQRAANNRHN